MEINLTPNDISALVVLARAAKFMINKEFVDFMLCQALTEYSRLVAWVIIFEAIDQTKATYPELVDELTVKGLLKKPIKYSTYEISKAQEAAKTIIKMA